MFFSNASYFLRRARPPSTAIHRMKLKTTIVARLSALRKVPAAQGDLIPERRGNLAYAKSWVA